MEKKKMNRKKLLVNLSWGLGTVVVLTSIGGAIYFVMKNTKKIKKVYWSPENFLEHAKKVQIIPLSIGPSNVNDLYNNFQNSKKSADEKRNAYFESHPDIKRKLENPKISKKAKEKLLENVPRLFDANEFLSTWIETSLNYEETKYLKFKYKNIELTNKPNELKVSYEIYLNYEYASGRHESSEIRETPKSKYYYANAQVITILTISEKWDQGSDYYKNLPLINEDFAKEIRAITNLKISHLQKAFKKANEILKSIAEKEVDKAKDQNSLDDLIKSCNELIAQLTKQAKEDTISPENKQKLLDNAKTLQKAIEDALNDKKWFSQDSFINAIFAKFVKSMQNYNAFPDIYPKDKYDIVLLENDGNKAVIWNQKLNSLTITFQYVSKIDKNLKSLGVLKTFNIEKV
ncbi:hypothetical protein [Metamycoplasma equirhinis]|uniref:hypothetical protein n=1 Tax=Metamycoplasma equirhinis TaxID=92402 RepID=UPI0035946AD5